ncbi:unnamed protein product [Heterobilharzia americana]|nr:unnamed protein product [Heterobilharzia americana]
MTSTFLWYLAARYSPGLSVTALEGDESLPYLSTTWIGFTHLLSFSLSCESRESQLEIASTFHLIWVC